MHTYSFGGGQLGGNAIIFQQYAIIAWLSKLLFAVEARAVPFIRPLQVAGFSLQLPGCRHHIYAPDLPFVKMHETFDGSMAGIITHRRPTASISILRHGIARKLHPTLPHRS